MGLKRILAICLAFCVFFAGFLSEKSAFAATTIDLYTVGPGNYVFSKFGHAAVCVTNDELPQGRCYDFGVSNAPDPGTMVWGTLRGQKEFTAVGVDVAVLVQTFSEQEREIWKQTLPLDEAHASALAKTLADAVENHDSYAYDPAFDNCTTELRDRLDVALDKKLSAPGPGTSSTKSTFRDQVEAPFSGRILEETLLALLVGVPGDRAPTPWEAMYLPFDLRDAVEARVGVKPEKIHGRDHGVELRTSANVGRMTLILIGLALTAILWASARKGPVPERRAIVGVGIFLGVIALAVDLTAILCTIFWVRENWVVAVLWPTDAAIGFLKPQIRERYVTIRLAVLALFALLSLVQMIAQPLVAVALFAFFPLWFVFRRLRLAKKA